MFKEDRRKEIANIFKDLWSINLDKIQGIQASFTSRLVALRKVFKEVPNRKQMRPILICSPIQKLLEVRFLPKLMKYLEDKMTPSQTGFVPNMGIQVNLGRAVSKIKQTTDRKGNVYGLFVDFVNAYNTVPHVKLFEKLRTKKCLDEEEIQYLEALYARYRIKIGKRIIRYNKGVAQGSILSPALFNIFIEDLVTKLAGELDLSIEDILLYADDILILCDSPNQLRKCIQIIENWSKENGMQLNRKKSGIVSFVNRKSKNVPYMECVKTTRKNRKGKDIIVNQWRPTQREFGGIPIVEKYKYMGTYLDSKLTPTEQLNYIRKKSNWLCTKLYPYLANATAEGRRDMWTTMVYPLFYGVLVLMRAEESVSELSNTMRLWLSTFKRFMLIPESTNTDLVLEMIGIDIIELMNTNLENASIKWYARKSREQIDDRIIKPKNVNYLKGI